MIGKKKIWIALIAIFIMVIISFWELISYGIQQAKGQWTVISEAIPVEKVLENETIDAETKRKIKLIQKARTFAFEDLGLKKNENYTSYFDQKGKEILWNISGCKPYEFEAKRWSFPFLGSFPYKGFFNKFKAKQELAKLKQQGYDTKMRPVGGWSTLGWFNDPILSNMLDQSDGRIAELIIHELTHGTIFVKDDIQFNENLASFIGEQGAVLFLKKEYGNHSPEFFEYEMEESDSKQFIRQMLKASQYLKRIYEKYKNETDSVKEIQKHIAIDEIMSSLDTLHFHNNRYYTIFEKNRPNNAYFMSYLRYHSSEDSLMNILKNKHNGILKEMVSQMKSIY